MLAQTHKSWEKEEEAGRGGSKKKAGSTNQGAALAPATSLKDSPVRGKLALASRASRVSRAPLGGKGGGGDLQGQGGRQVGQNQVGQVRQVGQVGQVAQCRLALPEKR